MTKQVFSCAPTDSLTEAERVMREVQVRRLPVVDGQNQPMGMVSLNDLAREAARPPTARKKNGVGTELLHTLADICTPRAGSMQAV